MFLFCFGGLNFLRTKKTRDKTVFRRKRTPIDVTKTTRPADDADGKVEDKEYNKLDLFHVVLILLDPV